MKKTTFWKSLFLLFALIVGSTSVWATDVTITMSQQGWSNDNAIGSGTLKSATNTNSIFSYSSGTGSDGATAGPKYFNSGSNVRFYSKNGGNGNGNWMQINVPANTTITGIEITGVSNYVPSVKYNIDGGSDVSWTASSNKYTVTNISATSSFKFRNANTSGNQLRITAIKITYTSVTPVTNITLNKSSLTLAVGGEETLSVTEILPTTATDKTVTWSSEDDQIASVDENGKVTAEAVGGPVNIIATANDGSGITATCAVTVVGTVVNVTGVSMNKNTTNLLVGGTETLTATVVPNDATDKKVTWSSNHPEFATVDNNGIVTAVAVGTARITVTTNDGSYTDYCDVTINPIVVTGVELNKTETSIVCEGTETLTATIAPANATNKNVSWESSNSAVASVENGVITANAVGTATITVTTEDQSKTATCTVTVTTNNTKPVLLTKIFDETFSSITSNANQALDVDELDNTGWSKTGSVYGGTSCIRMAKGDAGGSLKTPVIANMETGAVLSFYAKGWDSDEISISLSGTDCTLSQTSFNDLPYGDDFVEKTATITVTGDNPQITFTAASGVRIFIGEITISQSKEYIDVTLNASGFASYCSPFALDLTPNADFAAYAVKAAGSEAKNQVVFTRIPGKVAANMPFILYNPDKASTAVSLPIIEDDDPEIVSVSANELVGTLSSTYTAAATGYTNFGLSGAKFVPMNAGVVKPNKAYLPVNNNNIDTSTGARSLGIIFADENSTTSINTIDNGMMAIDDDIPIYNLAGQRVNKSYKGVVIVKGKKMLNK